MSDSFYVVGGYTATYSDFPDDWIYGPKILRHAINECYTPFGFGSMPPRVTVVYPSDGVSVSGGVDLVFTVNKPVVWLGYSLNGVDNVTVEGNVSLTGLPVGLRNVTVYAKDEFGNMGASETVRFTVNKSFPVVPVAAASGASAAIICLDLLAYSKKRKHQTQRD